MEKTKALDFDKLSHSELKDYGNKFFSASDNQRAIEFYSRAIQKNDAISSYYSNRALCYLQLKKYDQAFADCRRALELDPTNLKAFFFAGQCHLAIGQYEEAIAKLTTAHNLALENHRDFGDDITWAIRMAKAKYFEQQDEKRRRQEIELQSYLKNLVLQDALRRSQEKSDIDRGSDTLSVKIDKEDKNSSSQNVEPSLLRPASSPLHSDGEKNHFDISDIDSATAVRLREIDELFQQLDERRQKREVPDYLCGKISFEIMHDPVITPSGITYERRSIQAHLQQVGHFDPITRQPLTSDQLIPNLAMKEVISKFLEDHPWADGY